MDRRSLCQPSAFQRRNNKKRPRDHLVTLASTGMPWTLRPPGFTMHDFPDRKVEVDTFLPVITDC
jgi:hypothetical protein